MNRSAFVAIHYIFFDHIFKLVLIVLAVLMMALSYAPQAVDPAKSEVVFTYDRETCGTRRVNDRVEILCEVK